MWWTLRLVGVAGLFTVGATVLLVQSYYANRIGYAPPQPVPFSHRHHVRLVGLDCRYCHGQDGHMPTTELCMTCHSVLYNDSPTLAPVRQSLAQSQPLHWTRVTGMPDFVYFDHRVHLSNGVGCAECHGRVADMALTRQEKPMTMGWCLHCHENPGPRLRDPSLLYETLKEPPRDPERFMKLYHVQTDRLTDCTACHR